MVKTLPMPSARKPRYERALGSAFIIALALTVSAYKSAAAKDGDSAWFKPFSWQEPQVANPITTPPPRKFRRNLNPLKWSNEAKANATSRSTIKTIPSTTPHIAEPSEPNTPYVQIQDEPVQPGSTELLQPGSVILSQQATPPFTENQSIQASHEQAAVAWPASEEERREPSAQSADQGTNPFGWTNSGPPVPQTVYPRGERKWAELGNQPWTWSNSSSNQEKPREIVPPQDSSFNSAVLDALKWSDQPTEGEGQSSAIGFPPTDASKEEMIAWEKENLPWTRPFYWANDDTELGPQYEIIAPDATPSQDNVPLIARPFKWENRQAVYQPPTARPNGGTTYPTTQAAAFFQSGEALPTPGGVVTPPLDDPFADDPLANDPNAQGIDQEKKGGLAEAESLGEAPVDNSLQFLRADTVLLDPGEFQYEYGLIYSKFDLTLPVILSGGGGTTVELADFHIRELRVPLEIRYGLARRVQLFVNVPFGWSNTEFSFPGFEDFENDGGLGDIVFGSSILLRDNDPCNKPDAILTLSSVAPTGNEPFTPSGFSPSSPSLGSGVWSLAANLLFIQNYDPVVVFYGFGTRQSFEGELDNREFQPGGEYNYQFGVGFAVNRSITFSTRFNGAYVSDTRFDGQRLPGTTQEPMILSMAMTVSKNKKLIEPFVDFGLTDASTDARFGITWTH